MAERPQRKQVQQTAQVNKQQTTQDNNPVQNQQEYQQYNSNMIQTRSKKKVGILKVLGILIGIVGIIALIYLLGTGRVASRVVQLEQEIVDLQLILDNTIMQKNEDIKTLEQSITDMTVTELVPTTSLRTVEGTLTPELWLIGKDFVAPNELVLPYASDGANASYAQIGQKYAIRPSDRWLIEMHGAVFKFRHPQDISGEIKALSLTEKMSIEEIQGVIQKFYEGYPATTIKYKKIYLEEEAVGMLGTVTITVKEEIKDVDGKVTDEVKETQQVITVGFVQKSEYGLNFLFRNNTEDASTSEELIRLLLSSISYGNTGEYLKLE